MNWNWSYMQETLSWVNIGKFVQCDLEIWQAIGILSCATSNFVQHFVDICEFKLE